MVIKQHSSRTLRPGFPDSGRPRALTRLARPTSLSFFRPRALTRLARPESEPTDPEITRGRAARNQPGHAGARHRDGGNGPRTEAGEPHQGPRTTAATDPRPGNASREQPDPGSARPESATRRPEPARARPRQPRPEHRPRSTTTRHRQQHTGERREPTSRRPFAQCSEMP